jgi:phospholipid/cholesterol/gamma-HCH transport system ATP-binding protein
VLNSPAKGQVFYEGVSFWEIGATQRQRIMHRFGILYQSGALWSSMTLAENIALPLEEYTELNSSQIRELVSLKLALVGLAGFEDYYPAEISGGMRKRAALARAIALDPDILFFDEPSAGLDPISARRLDELILELRESLGTTIIVVTHELASIFAIGNNSVFLDADSRTMIASGDPHKLLSECENAKVRSFLTRGESDEETKKNGRSDEEQSSCLR